MTNRHVLTATAALGFLALLPLDAFAAGCTAGVYRAGCAGPNGAVVVKKPPQQQVTCAKGVHRAGCVGPNGATAVRR